jgi:SAM-dependent methyltransferase
MPPGRDADVSVKPAAYLPVYEELLAPLRGRPFCMLELGIWRGDSLEMWRNAFPEATIVGVDLTEVPVDLGPKVHAVQGDQANAALLGRIRAELAPGGFDVIIDDCAHIGAVAAASLQALYVQHLRPGGLYVIEDWGTGYLTDWPDGRKPAAMIGADHLALNTGEEEGKEPPKATVRLPSHDAGMVGLIKRLVDHTAAGTLAVYQPDRVQGALPIAWMRIQDGLVILRKPAGP